MDALARNAERLGDVIAREARVDDHDVARARRVRVLRRRASRRVRACTHSGKCSGTRSWIIVERTPARCGGYIQSLKWSTSKSPSDALGRRAGRAGSSAVRTACAAGRTGSRRSTVDPVERRLDRAFAAPARRRERDQLVAAGLGEAERASRGCSCRRRCVDARAARRRRRFSPGGRDYSNPPMSTPSVRGSGLFNAG